MPEDATAHAINNLSAVLGSLNVTLVSIKNSLEQIAKKLDDPPAIAKP